MVCLYSLLLTTYSQSPHPTDHWRMTEDQMVHGPFPEFAKMWANRTIADGQIRKASHDIARQQVVIDDQDRLIVGKDSVIQSYVVMNNEQREIIGETNQDLVNCVDEKGKLKGWAKFGKWTAGTGAVVIVLGAAVIVKNTFFP